MDQLMHPDIAGKFQQGYAFGTQVKQQRQAEQDNNALRGLAPQIIAGDPGAFEQAAAINPEAAGKYQGAGDQQLRRLSGAIDYFDQALKSGDDRLIQARFREISPFLSKITGQPAPPAYTSEMAPAFEQVKTKIAMAKQGNQSGVTPSGFTEIDMKLKAAGYQPGTPEYQEGMRIATGQQGRAATGGFGFEMVEGLDGHKRLQRRNPRTGIAEVYDELTGDFTPIGGGAGLNGGAPPPAASGPAAGLPSVPGSNPQDIQRAYQDIGARNGFEITSMQRPILAGIGAGANSQHPNGTAVDYRVTGKSRQQIEQLMADLRQQGFEVIDESDGRSGTGPHIHAELPPGGGRAPSSRASSLAVGRSPEEQAALTEAAKLGAQNANFGNQFAQESALTGMKTQAQLDQARQEAGIKNDAEIASQQGTRSRDADSTLSLLDEAEKLIPQSTGSFVGNVADTAAGAVGTATEGAKAIAALQTIAGQLTSKMPRMQGPQSDKDVVLYKQMAGDLANPNLPRETRLAALKTIRRLNEQYASGGQAAAAPGAPQPGTVQDGYRFRGGNPADPNSWERL